MTELVLRLMTPPPVVGVGQTIWETQIKSQYFYLNILIKSSEVIISVTDIW